MTTTSRPAPALLALVGVALAIGAGAALLSGATPPASPYMGPTLANVLPAEAWGVLFLLPLVIGFGALIVRRVRNTALPLGQWVAFAVVMMVFALGLYAVAHLVGGGEICFCYGTSIPVSNNSSHSGPPGNNSTLPPIPHVVNPALSISNLLPYVILIAVTFAAAAVAIPVLLSRAPRRRSSAGTAPNDPRELRAAFSEAVSALDEGRDPGLVIVRLYNRLLTRVRPLQGDLDFLTAQEIRTTQLLPLGVRPAAADALTRLFEEARYSTHPMGPTEVGQTRDAIRAVEADLARLGSAA
jgi:hypothetical protein